jgi:hypothetical protein
MEKSIPRTKYYGETLGVDCFWPIKNVSLKVGIISTSPNFVEWGCMNSSAWRDSTIWERRKFHLLSINMPQHPPLKMNQSSSNQMRIAQHPITFPTIVMIVSMATLAL